MDGTTRATSFLNWLDRDPAPSHKLIPYCQSYLTNIILLRIKTFAATAHNKTCNVSNRPFSAAPSMAALSLTTAEVLSMVKPDTRGRCRWKSAKFQKLINALQSPIEYFPIWVASCSSKWALCTDLFVKLKVNCTSTCNVTNLADWAMELQWRLRRGNHADLIGCWHPTKQTEVRSKTCNAAW